MPRLILSADLHAEPVKFQGIEDAARREHADIICCAGDLVDHAMPRAGQTRYVRDFVRRSNFPWIACSGNHDFDFNAESPFPVVPNWMDDLGAVQDGQTRRIGDLAITTIPWPVVPDTTWRGLVDRLIEQGQALSATIPWLILIHEPPNDSRLGAGYKSERAELTSEIISNAEPDYALFAHIHQTPEYASGDWISPIQGGIGFQAGQAERGVKPQYIVLDIKPGGWQADHSHF